MVREAAEGQAGAMTTTPPEAPPEPGPEHDSGPRATREEVRDLGRLRRSSTDSKVAGVAGGLARHLDVDPVILRVAFVVLVFFGGAGLILYGACWLLVPSDDDVEAPFHLDERTRSVALTIVGVVALLSMLGDSWGIFSFPWPLALVALAALLLLNRSDRKRRERPAQPYAQPYDQLYAPPYGEQAGWTAHGGPTDPVDPPTRPYAAAYAPYDQQHTQTYAQPYLPPRNPRRRGPVLFWFTLALAALGIGVLGLLDMSGVPVADAAYPALVTATCGVMLLVGAFWGRAGGLVAVGLLAVLATSAATVAGELEGTQVDLRPTTAAGLASSYETGAGETVIDLTGITDLEALDGRTLLLEAGVGRIEVLVPPGLDVEAEVSVGIGNARVFGSDRGGLGIEDGYSHDAAGTGNPALTIDAHLGVGQVEIHTEGDLR